MFLQSALDVDWPQRPAGRFQDFSARVSQPSLTYLSSKQKGQPGHCLLKSGDFSVKFRALGKQLLQISIRRAQSFFVNLPSHVERIQ